MSSSEWAVSALTTGFLAATAGLLIKRLVSTPDEVSVLKLSSAPAQSVIITSVKRSKVEPRIRGTQIWYGRYDRTQCVILL